MEELNKTQLILLALLLSFVTSIATGVVTVALMDQAPPGVTQTINRVVEKTVEVIQPGKETQVIVQETVLVTEGDLVEEAVQKNLDSLVVFYVVSGTDQSREIGSGFLVTTDGLVATEVDIADRVSSEEVFASCGGEIFNTRLVFSENGNYATIVQLDGLIQNPGDEDMEVEPKESSFKSVKLASDGDVNLGSTVIGMDATGDVSIAIGMVTMLERWEVLQEDGAVTHGDIRYVHTSISMPQTVSGGPLVSLGGDVAGLAFVSMGGNVFAIPSKEIMDMLGVIEQKGVETMIGEQSASVLEYDFGESDEETVLEEELLTE